MDRSVQVPSDHDVLAFTSNVLLSLLPPARTSQHLTRVRLVNGQVLHEAGERIEHVYFVGQGFVSMLAVSDDTDDQTEVGLVGRESMVGVSALLGPEAVSFNRAVVQMPGFAHRMNAQVLRDSVGTVPALRRLLFQALEVTMAQVAQTAACNSRHAMPQRLARWLLMAHDRVDGDELALTQEFLSVMLAVQRPSVTLALQALQEAGAISQKRGRILVCDRPGLEAAACGCYGRIRAFEAVVAARNAAAPRQSDAKGRSRVKAG